MSKPPSTPYRLNKRHIRIGSVLTMLLYIFVILIPMLYEWRAVIPPFAQLQVTSGELTYQDVGKRGDRQTGIKTSSGTVFFTCGPGKLSHPDCLPYTEHEKFAGKPATVWWFEQPVYLFSTHKRLVRLVVAGEDKMTYEKTLQLSDSATKSAPWFIWIALILFVSIVIGFERMIRRQDHEQPNG